MTSKDRIRELRLSLGMTQKEFSELVGVMPHHVSRWEGSDRHDPLLDPTKINAIKLNWLFAHQALANPKSLKGKRLVVDTKVKVTKYIPPPKPANIPRDNTADVVE
jgi:DNA-binding XRE family transcriptional regulator